MATVLCIDDDPYLTDLLQYALGRDGFSVQVAATGRDALRLLHTAPIDLCVLDVTLPDIDGFTVLSALRRFSPVPVIMLTGRVNEADIVAGYQHGADDYVVKPFSSQVLSARIKAVLRRGAKPRWMATVTAPYRLAEAVFDPQRREIVGPERVITLTARESRILHLLAHHAGHALSAQQIVEQLWDDDHEVQSSVVKTHIAHLRKKMSRLATTAHALQTVPGGGYRLHTVEETA